MARWSASLLAFLLTTSWVTVSLAQMSACCWVHMLAAVSAATEDFDVTFNGTFDGMLDGTFDGPFDETFKQADI